MHISPEILQTMCRHEHTGESGRGGGVMLLIAHIHITS